jgi:cell cycle arrest protein BUB3
MGNILRYDFHSGSQDTVGLHEDVLACIEFSSMTGKEDTKQSYVLMICV